MTASLTDLLAKTYNSANPNVARVTSPRSIGGTTLSCDNLSGWPDDTVVHFSTYRLDTNNDVIPGSQTDWIGIVSGNNIGSLTRITGASDGGNANNDVVEMNPTAKWANNLITAILVHSNQDGTLKNDAVSTPSIADSAVTTAKLNNSAVTTAKITDANVTKAKLEKPHYNKLMWSTTGGGSGQVVGTQTTANFDASDTTNGYGITATTGAGAYMTIARDGLYDLTAQLTLIDASGSFQKLGIIWFTFSFDNGSTTSTVRCQDRNWNANDGSSQQYSKQVWLPAGTRVSLQWYANPAAVRYGAPSPSGGTTDYLARSVFGSYLSIAEVR